MTALLPLDEARALVVAAVAAPLEAEAVEVGDAPGRVLAEDVLAAADVPPFANSAISPNTSSWRSGSTQVISTSGQ